MRGIVACRACGSLASLREHKSSHKTQYLITFLIELGTCCSCLLQRPSDRGREIAAARFSRIEQDEPGACVERCGGHHNTL